MAIQNGDVIVAAGYDDEIDIDVGAFYTFDISTELVVNPPVSTSRTNDFFKNIHLFPNPTSGDFYIRFDTSLSFNYPITIQVFDISGKLIHEQSIYQDFQNNQSISLNDMANGIYVVKIIIDNQVFIGKIMKH